MYSHIYINRQISGNNLDNNRCKVSKMARRSTKEQTGMKLKKKELLKSWLWSCGAEEPRGTATIIFPTKCSREPVLVIVKL